MNPDTMGLLVVIGWGFLGLIGIRMMIRADIAMLKINPYQDKFWALNRPWARVAGLASGPITILFALVALYEYRSMKRKPHLRTDR